MPVLCCTIHIPSALSKDLYERPAAFEFNMDEANDFAVVIGIDQYDEPEFTPLSGAHSDAKEFITWLQTDYVAKSGLKKDNIIFNKQKEATYSDINRLFKQLLAKAEKSKAEKSPRGKLYIFVAGHGSGASLRDSLLFTSEHSWKLPMCYDLTRMADALRYSDYFKEILMFVDCCRNMRRYCALPIPLDLGGTESPATHFYCFGSVFGETTMEQTFGSKVAGVFSMHLLRALRGRVENTINQSGQVTAHRLVRHLSSAVQQWGASSGTDHDPHDEDVLKRMVLVAGFPAPVRTIEVELSKPEEGFALFSGKFLTPLHWQSEPVSKNLFRIYWEEEDLKIITVAVPRVKHCEAAERTVAATFDQRRIRV